MNKTEILNSIGLFSWCWGEYFIVEINGDIYIWSDPGYGGDNSFTRFYGTFRSAALGYAANGGITRDKGYRIVREYCGHDIIVS